MIFVCGGLSKNREEFSDMKVLYSSDPCPNNMPNKAYSGGQNNNSVLKEICRGIYTWLKYINTPE